MLLQGEVPATIQHKSERGQRKNADICIGGYFSRMEHTIATYFKRYNGSLSLTHKATDKITFTAGINGSSSEQRTPLNSGYFSNPVIAHFFEVPWFAAYNADGTPRYGDTTEFYNGGGIFNPIAVASLDRNTASRLVSEVIQAVNFTLLTI